MYHHTSVNKSMHTCICRVLSRALLIPFDLPSCGPVTIEECSLYMKFQKDCEDGRYSALVGWVIQQEKVLIESGNSRIQELRELLQTRAEQSMVARNLMSSAVCLYFLEKVFVILDTKCTRYFLTRYCAINVFKECISPMYSHQHLTSATVVDN